MNKNFKILINLSFYWFVSLSIAAVTVASINFFSALNFPDYTLRFLISSEFSYLFKTIYTLFLLSGVFALPAFLFNLFYLMVLANKQTIINLITHLILLVAYCFILEHYNLLLNHKSFTLLMPVYVVVLTLFYFPFFRRKIKNIISQSNS